MTATLDAILDAQGEQLTIDEYLALGDDAPNPNGTCPHAAKCDIRRRGLAVYRQHQPCHWIAFKDVGNCPISNNGGDK